MANNTCTGASCGTGGWNGPLPGDPDNSSVLSAVPEYGGIRLSWSVPNINGFAVAHTRIFRGTTDVFANTVPLDPVAGYSYFDKSAADVIQPYYYWIQHVSIYGTVLTPVGPAVATAFPLIDQILEGLTNKVESSMLATALRSRVDKVVDLEVGLNALDTRVTTENGVVTQELLGLRDDLTDALAYVSESRTIDVTERQAMMTAINTQLAQVNSDLYAAIQDEATVRADETGALFAQKILKFDLAGNISGVGLSAEVDPDGTATSEFQVRADMFSIAAPAVSQATPPANPYNGKVWVDTSVVPNVTRWYNKVNEAWQTTPVVGTSPFIVMTTPQVVDGATLEPGIYLNKAFVGKLTANEIDTRGLSIKDASGNVILAAGTAVDWTKLGGAASNLANLGYNGDLNATRNVYRGAWTSSTNYTKGDIVIYDNYGWSCEQSHTSTGVITPPTYPATSNAYWVLAAVSGGGGVDGADAITAILSNEAHVFSAATDGTVASYANSGTEIHVYQGASELVYDGVGTSNGTWKVTTAVFNISLGTLTDSGTYLTVGDHLNFAPANEVASVTYTITGKSTAGVNFSITKQQSFSKSKAGAAGAAATAYWLQTSVPAVQKSIAGVYTPSAVTYTLMSAMGANAPAAYAGRFVIATTTDGTTYTDQYTSSANESSKTYTVPAGIKAIRVRAYLAGGVTTLVDEMITTVVNDGATGANGSRTAILEMYQWAASAPTTFPSGASTYTWNTGLFTAPATPNGWSLTPPAAVAGQTLWMCRTIYSDSGSTSTSSVTWAATQAYASGAAGSNGVNGTRTAILELYQWSVAAPTTFPSGNSTYTWNTGAFTAPATLNGWSLTPGTATAGQTLWGCQVAFADTGTSATSSVPWTGVSTAYAVGAAGANGAPGVSGLSAVLSNEAHTFPTNSSGTVSSYVGSGTELRVYEGATELAYDGVGTANGTWKVTAAGTNITPGSLTDSGTYLTVGVHSGVADGTDTSSITYTITGKTAGGTSFNFTKLQTFTKSKQGAQGSTGLTGPQGPAVSVVVSRPATFTATDGALDGGQSNITFTASVSGISSPTYVWSFFGFQTPPSNSGTNVLTITPAQFGTSKGATVTCTVNGTYQDVITVVRLEKSTAAAGATVGATLGVNVGGQITSSNASTLIADAAIGTAQIGELDAIKIVARSIKTEKLEVGSATANASFLYSSAIDINPSNTANTFYEIATPAGQIDNLAASSKILLVGQSYVLAMGYNTSINALRHSAIVQISTSTDNGSTWSVWSDLSGYGYVTLYNEAYTNIDGGTRNFRHIMPLYASINNAASGSYRYTNLRFRVLRVYEFTSGPTSLSYLNPNGNVASFQYARDVGDVRISVYEYKV